MPEEKQVFNGLEDVEASLGRLSVLNAERKKRTAAIDAQIAQLNGQKKEAMVDIDHQISMEELSIRQYVLNNMDEFRTGKKKSIEFTTGLIKTKEAQVYDYPDTEDLVALIESVGKAYTDLLKINRVPQKALIKAAIQKDPSIADFLDIAISTKTAIIIEPN